MTGRAEIDRQRQQLDATFQRAGGLHHNAELLSDFARLLCVRVSGFVEQATIELLIEYARINSDKRIVRHVDRSVRRLTNLKTQRLIDVIGTLDPDWQRELTGFIVNEYKDALDGIVALRNQVAHGRSVGITFSQVSDYYQRIKAVVNRVADIVIPR